MRKNKKENAAGQIPGKRGYGGIFEPYDYVNSKYGKGWEVTGSGTLEPDIGKFLMNDLEKGANNCTLTAATRAFAYYRDNKEKRNIPDNKALYRDIKSIAEKYGYRDGGDTHFTKINNIINDTFKKYGYKGKGKSIYAWDFKALKKEIDAGRPLLFNIAFGYYKNHTVSVVGYIEFSNKKRIFKRTKRLIRVYDGWTASDRYIDYDRIIFGSFSTVKFV